MRLVSVALVSATLGWLAVVVPEAAAATAPHVVVQSTVLAQAGGAAALVDVSATCSSSTPLPIDVTLYQGRAHTLAQGAAYEISTPCDGSSHAQRVPVFLDNTDDYGSPIPSAPFTTGSAVVILGDGTGKGSTWPVHIVRAAAVQRLSNSLAIAPTADLRARGAVLDVTANVVCPAGHRRGVAVDVAQQQGPASVVLRFSGTSGTVSCTGQSQLVHVTVLPSDRAWRAGPAFLGASLCQAGEFCVSGPPRAWRTITVE